MWTKFINFIYSLVNLTNPIFSKFIPIIFLAFIFSIFLSFLKLNSQTFLLTSEKAEYSIIDKFPSGERWIEHLNQELMPFWTMESALGNPIGNFPTFRCNDGSLVNPTNLCPEFKHPMWRKKLNKDYVISKSRQTYAYGVAYHLTGDEKMLELAKAGVDYLRNNAWESNTGSAIAYWEDGIANPPVLERNTQQLAYALLGLSFYYYLTRDDDVLQDILNLKNYIFVNYYNPDWDLLMWVQQDPEETATSETKPSEWKRLPAQLDQLTCYLFLITPLLAEPLKTEWTEDLVHLSNTLIEQFYNPKDNYFLFELNEPDKKMEGQGKNFGPTIKAFWMIYQISKFTKNNDLSQWVELQAPKFLQQAYIAETGSWGLKFNPDGEIDQNKLWWVYAELDQMTATLSLKYISMSQYLINTYDYWFQNFVDSKNHEVWHMLNSQGYPVNKYPKCHYKNGYHSLEHTLVGYITSQEINDKPVVLYYAFSNKNTTASVRPYFFDGTVHKRQTHPMNRFKNKQKVTVSFRNIS